MPETESDQRPITQADLEAVVGLIAYHAGGIVGLLTLLLKIQLGSLVVIALLLLLLLFLH